MESRAAAKGTQLATGRTMLHGEPMTVLRHGKNTRKMRCGRMAPPLCESHARGHTDAHGNTSCTGVPAMGSIAKTARRPWEASRCCCFRACSAWGQSNGSTGLFELLLCQIVDVSCFRLLRKRDVQRGRCTLVVSNLSVAVGIVRGGGQRALQRAVHVLRFRHLFGFVCGEERRLGSGSHSNSAQSC